MFLDNKQPCRLITTSTRAKRPWIIQTHCSKKKKEKKLLQSERISLGLSLFLTARFWQHWWRVLAGSGEHLLVDQPGQLQAAGHAGGLVRPQGVRRVRQLQAGARGRLLQAEGGTLPRQRRGLAHLAQRQTVHHTGPRPWRLHRWEESGIE